MSKSYVRSLEPSGAGAALDEGRGGGDVGSSCEGGSRTSLSDVAGGFPVFVVVVVAAGGVVAGGSPLLEVVVAGVSGEVTGGCPVLAMAGVAASESIAVEFLPIAVADGADGADGGGVAGEFPLLVAAVSGKSGEVAGGFPLLARADKGQLGGGADGVVGDA